MLGQLSKGGSCQFWCWDHSIPEQEVGLDKADVQPDYEGALCMQHAGADQAGQGAGLFEDHSQTGQERGHASSSCHRAGG